MSKHDSKYSRFPYRREYACCIGSVLVACFVIIKLVLLFSAPWFHIGLLGSKSSDKLTELHYTLRRPLLMILDGMASRGFKPRLLVCWRSLTDQEYAYKQGASKLLFGFHNITDSQGQPCSFAADIGELGRSKPSPKFLLALARAANDQGLTTGIYWGLDKDACRQLTIALQQPNCASEPPIGWDPTHIQPAHMTIKEALALARRRRN